MGRGGAGFWGRCSKGCFRKRFSLFIPLTAASSLSPLSFAHFLSSSLGSNGASLAVGDPICLTVYCTASVKCSPPTSSITPGKFFHPNKHLQGNCVSFPSRPASAAHLLFCLTMAMFDYGQSRQRHSHCLRYNPEAVLQEATPLFQRHLESGFPYNGSDVCCDITSGFLVRLSTVRMLCK